MTAGEDNDISDCEEFFGEENTASGRPPILNVNNGETFTGAFTVVIVYEGEVPVRGVRPHPGQRRYAEFLAECGETPEPPCFELEVDWYANTTTVTFYPAGERQDLRSLIGRSGEVEPTKPGLRPRLRPLGRMNAEGPMLERWRIGRCRDAHGVA